MNTNMDTKQTVCNNCLKNSECVLDHKEYLCILCLSEKTKKYTKQLETMIETRRQKDDNFSYGIMATFLVITVPIWGPVMYVKRFFD